VALKAKGTWKLWRRGSVPGPMQAAGKGGSRTAEGGGR